MIAHPLDFLIAGVQKGGTTALWHFLRQHPQIRLGSRKELHFFDDETHNWENPDYQVLHREYLDENPSGDALCGDATPIYTYWTPSLERIHDYNRHIKLIVSLRDPVERAYSHWRMETLRNAETLPFAEAIREGRKRVSEQAERDGLHRTYSYVERGFYAAQLDRVFSFFAREQVLLLRQADLNNRFEATMDDICDFLGAGRFEAYPPNEMVFSFEAEIPEDMAAADREYLTEMFRPDLITLRETYGLDLAHHVRHGNLLT